MAKKYVRIILLDSSPPKASAHREQGRDVKATCTGLEVLAGLVPNGRCEWERKHLMVL